MKLEDAKKHPLFSFLALSMGEKQAMITIKKAVEDQEKENQAETEVSKKAKKITIPASMNKLQASKELKRQWNDEETVIDVDRSFADWNWKDFLVAVKKAAERHFGWIEGKTTYSFFGVNRPREIEILTNIKDGKRQMEACFYGEFTASVWEDATIDVGGDRITATVKKRYAADVREFFDLIQDILDKESIYRGKSITVTKKEDPWGNVSLDFDIFEMKTSDRIILNTDVEGIVQNFVIDDLGQEGKRCYLFSGGYGNGKTETAMRVGAAGNARGMAYFYCKDAEVFHMLLKQAVNYQPCIVFLEDVDEIGSGNRRDADMNRILNTLDGVQTKGNNLTVIFTTNHEKRINPALRRPGRIDIVINFGNPDKVSVGKIYEAYFTGMPGADSLDYQVLAENTPECPGAVVAEIAKRAYKLGAKHNGINDQLVIVAIDSMKHHLKLMSERAEENNNGSMNITITGAKITATEVEETASAKVKAN